MTLDRDTKLSIIRQYIADGDSMERVAGSHGVEIAEVSSIIRHYGFNMNRTGAFQSGEDRGAFRYESMDSDFDSILEKYTNEVDRGTMRSTFRQFLDSENCRKRPVKSGLNKSALESACSSTASKPRQTTAPRPQYTAGNSEDDEFFEFIGMILIITVILMFVLKFLPFWSRLVVSFVLGAVVCGLLKAKAIMREERKSGFESTPLAKRLREQEGNKNVKRVDDSSRGEKIVRNIIIGIFIYIVIWRFINYGHL